MSVEFDEEKKFNNMYRESVSGAGLSSLGLTGWLIKKNIVKDEKGAKSFMVIIMVLCFGLAIFLLIK